MLKGQDIKVAKTGNEDGIKWAVLKLNWDGEGHYCAYLKVPKSNPAYNIQSYDDIPLSVHGGLTYLDDTLSEMENGRWIGWDYAHAGDREHNYMAAEVITDAIQGAKDLKKLTWKEIIEEKLEWMPEWFTERIQIKGESNAN